MSESTQLVASPEDTIVARATAAGVGSVAIVRASGSRAAEILERCFLPHSKASMESHKMALGRWGDPATGEVIDTVLAVRFDAPHSYTGETVVEAHTHAGLAIVDAIIDTFVDNGARLATPGEYTRRAFLNGKMDLAQAEAVADLSRASTTRARQLAERQLDGALSRHITDMRERLVAVVAELEAYLDFPEEDLPEGDEARITQAIEELRDEARRLVEQGRRGRLGREGARVVIAGPPNAGKSSLFNALVGRERAIVSPHAGTTRDTIECTLDLKGLAVTLVDTAGMRDDEAGHIERIGIERAADEIRNADLALWVTDLTKPASSAPPPRESLEGCDAPWITVGAKLDWHREMRRPMGPGEQYDCMVSSLSGEGVEGLENALISRLPTAAPSATDDEDGLVSNRRHIDLLDTTDKRLDAALTAMREGASSEFAIVDLRVALTALSDVIGVDVGDEILDSIFSRFCIGK